MFVLGVVSVEFKCPWFYAKNRDSVCKLSYPSKVFTPLCKFVRSSVAFFLLGNSIWYTKWKKNWRLYLIITSRSPWILINYGSGNVCVWRVSNFYLGLHIALTPFTKLKVLKNYGFRRMVANSHKKTNNTKNQPKKQTRWYLRMYVIYLKNKISQHSTLLFVYSNYLPLEYIYIIV